MEGCIIGHEAFPARALLARIANGEDVRWAAYLPDGLRPTWVAPWCYPTACGAEESHSSRSTPCEGSKKVSTPSTAMPSPAGRAACQPSGVPVTGRVWELSRNAQGCREVQRAMDECKDVQALLAIALELDGHVWEAMRCPHANHVLQKSISMLPPHGSQFIIDAIVGCDLIVQASRHKYACRIVQRVLENCTWEQLLDTTQALIHSATHIACHPYGNYVIQHLLEHADEEALAELCQVLHRNIRGLASDPHGCAVVSAALTMAFGNHQVALAQALIKEPSLLVYVACSRHGHLAAEAAVQVLYGQEKEKAKNIFRAEQGTLMTSRHGRLVAASLGLCPLEGSSAKEPALAAGWPRERLLATPSMRLPMCGDRALSEWLCPAFLSELNPLMPGDVALTMEQISLTKRVNKSGRWGRKDITIDMPNANAASLAALNLTTFYQHDLSLGAIQWQIRSPHFAADPLEVARKGIANPAFADGTAATKTAEDHEQATLKDFFLQAAAALDSFETASEAEDDRGSAFDAAFAGGLLEAVLSR